MRNRSGGGGRRKEEEEVEKSNGTGVNNSNTKGTKDAEIEIAEGAEP